MGHEFHSVADAFYLLFEFARVYMISKILNTFFLFFLSYCLLTQVVSCATQNFHDKYSVYVKKLEDGHTNINYKEFRESFVESSQFIIASKKNREIDSLGREMFASIEKSAHQQTIAAAKGILKIDFTSMIAHKILGQAYEAIGDTKAGRHRAIEFGLLNSILKDGDGKTCKTAWPVIQIAEEEFILQMLGADIQNVEIGNRSGKCDKFEVKIDNQFAIYYFETSKIFQGHKKLTTER